MHLSDGIVTGTVLLGGTAAAAAGLTVGLRQLTPDRIPRVAILSSAFFVASLIHVPVGPVSVHLVLNGINGLLLGWAAFPSIFVALTLQMLLFQFGGITVLGLNTLNMALPAVIAGMLFGPMVRGPNKRTAVIGGFLAGSLSVLMGGLLVAFSLFLSGEQFLEAAAVALTAHIPIMLVEGFITAVCIVFIRKVKPEILNVNWNLVGGKRSGTGEEL
jgi:cobalt/nickel transport system permease protein